MPRVDKVLAQYQFGSRQEVKQLVKKKLVTVNDELITNPSFQIQKNDTIRVDDYLFQYHPFVYYMMNKQMGRICAHDAFESIYSDLDDHYPNDISSIGRLDKATTGLIILTNDGQLNHQVTSKNNRILKSYLIKTQDKLSNIEVLNNPIYLEPEGYVHAKSIDVLSDDELIIGITDGKYHQIKRMIHAINNEVIELHRLSIGRLELDQDLKPGEYRELNEFEIERLLYEEMD